MGSKSGRFTMEEIREAEAKHEREIRRRQEVKEKILESGELIDRVFVVMAVTEEELQLKERGTDKVFTVIAHRGDWDKCELDYNGSLIEALINDDVN